MKKLENNGISAEEYEQYLSDYNETCVDWTIPAWSSDVLQIPYDTEVTVAWNFTNSMHTKSIVIRYQTDPDHLWIDALGPREQFINLSDACYWIGYPELPKD